MVKSYFALGGRGGWITRSRDRDHPGQHGETPSLLKIQKISWAWWCVPVIPATQEAEAGELPEPRRRSLWWAEITPLHSSLGNKSETPSRKKRKRNEVMSLLADKFPKQRNSWAKMPIVLKLRTSAMVEVILRVKKFRISEQTYRASPVQQFTDYAPEWFRRDSLYYSCEEYIC